MAYAAIAVEGGLFPPDLLDDLSAGKGPGQAPADFGLDGARLSDEMQAAFSDARSFWDAFQRRLVSSKESRVSLTRQAWVIPLLERLGFDDLRFTQAAVQIGGDAFPISHRAGDDPDAPPVQIVALDDPLGSRGAAKRSPHALVQEFLNRSDALWGLVGNGEKIRLLRDSNRFAKPTYVEFDLGGMIAGNLYSEFVLLYRLLHRSRFPNGAADAAGCVLERLHQSGLETGGRVREHLRDGVAMAIDELGAAFLRHPKSAALRHAVETGQLPPDAYYRQLLRLVYRLLFLFVAEERRLIYPEGQTDPEAPRRHRIYDACYSVARLRRRVERPFADDREIDAWLGLIETFRVFRFDDHARALGLAALNGELFGGSACPDLEAAQCENRAFFRAIRHLSTFDGGGGRMPVNYAALDVEELGSVYESLLDLQPSVDLDDRQRPFRLISGTERKTTGSYYTPSSLVHELIESALAPVIRERLAGAKTAQEKEAALLGIRVCDPAAGSGHFLLAAARRLGRELATVRTGEASPAPEAYREAVRDVIRACIYAVDKNPLASDLCKVALWIEGHHAGLPLSFLDHHVKAGDSLVGVYDLSVLTDGIPDEAYAAVTGDDKHAAAHIKKVNQTARRRSEENLQQRPLALDESALPANPTSVLAGEMRAFSDLPERTPDDVHAKEELYAALREPGGVWDRGQRACHLWTSAFFLPLVESAGGVQGVLAPTSADVQLALTQPQALNGQLVGAARAAAQRLGFFHWPLEFPDVMQAGGFDVILANPPWERVKLQEQEFFAASDFEIANAPNKAARQRLIDALAARNPDLLRRFDLARHDAEATSKFLRGAGRYPLTGRGDVNTYSVFAELMTELAGDRGRMGVIVPTGIATDDTNKLFFGHLVETGRLRAILDYENREAIFPGVHRSYKFSMLVVGAASAERRFDAAFFLTQASQLREPGRVFTLTAEEIALLNPNTKTCPIFRSARDAEITKAIYRAAPVLVREGPPEVNPWGVTFKTLFHMSNDSGLFKTRENLEGMGFRLDADGRFYGANERWLPLYEAKMIHQFDHRFATYEGGAAADKARDLTLAEHADPAVVALPRYWVPEPEVEKKLTIARKERPSWFLGYREIARSTDERTSIASVMPWAAINNKAPLLFFERIDVPFAALLGNLNSFAFDYSARQKIGGTSFSFFLLKQLPVLPPETYTPALLDEIVPRVVELVYTAHDLTAFARDCGCDGPPFIWDETRRAELRAELDGVYAHLYGLSRDDFAYILDTFPIVARNDEKTHGEFRTKRLCLAAWDRFAGISG